MTFAPTDPSQTIPAFIGLEGGAGGPCRVTAEAYNLVSTDGPDCTSAWGITFDTSWLSTTPLGAYAYTYGEDGVAIINANGSSNTVFPAVTNGGEMGGVAVRDGAVWALDAGQSGNVNPRIFLIANGASIPVFELDYVQGESGYGCYLPGSSAPRTMVVGEDGRLYVASGGSNCQYSTGLQVYGIGNGGDSLIEGTLIDTIAPGVTVESLATDTAGHIYFNDASGNLYRYPSTTHHQSYAIGRKAR